jgi:hypothetical protein
LFFHNPALKDWAKFIRRQAAKAIILFGKQSFSLIGEKFISMRFL